jgi:hypothetical protein
MRRVLKASAAAGAAAAVLGLSLSVLGVTAASAATTNGVATIENSSESAPLTGVQGSATPFTVGLPAGAACDGDTATDGWGVVSYMVPQSVYGTNGANLPGLVSYSGGFEQVGLGYFAAGGAPLTSQPTAPVSGDILSNVQGPWQWSGLSPTHVAAVGTGPLASPYQNELIPAGGSSQVWESGIACINASGVITDWWNAEITFTASSSDTNGYTWTPTTSTGANVPESPLNVALPLGGGLILLAAFGITWRRRRHASLPDTVSAA